MAEFLSMGGYGAFVWPCYAIVFVLMIALLWQSVADLRRQQRLVDRLENGAAQRPRPAGKRNASR